MTMVILGRRLWLTADKSRVVEDGDPEARFLYCAEGAEVSEDEARRYGLLPKTKAVAGPPEDKAKKGRSTKAAPAEPAEEEAE